MKSTKKRPSKAKPTRGSSTIKFTTLGLDRIKPTGKRQWFTEASDSKDRSGLKLCVEPTGAKRFVARIHVAGDVIDGKRMYVARDTTLGTYGDQPGQIDIAEAHRRLAKVRAEIAAGKSPVPFIVRAARPARRLKRRQRREPSPLFDRTPDGARPSPPDGEHSIEMLAYEFYWEFAVAERRRPEYVQRILERDVLRHFKGRDVRTITTRDVTLFLREIAERAPVMANRVQSLMFQMLRFGAEVGLLDSAPSTPLRKAGGKEKSRDRVLADAELKQLFERLPGARMTPAVQCAIRILAFTGARRGEIAQARWSDVGSDLWVIPASASKTGHPHSFPITDAVRAEFDKLRRISGESIFVMPSPAGNQSLDPHAITTAMRRSLKHFGIGEATVHDLRRTVRTGMTGLGISDDIAERTIGHVVGTRIQRTYDVHDREKERRDALQKWADHVMAVLTAKAAA